MPDPVPCPTCRSSLPAAGGACPVCEATRTSAPADGDATRTSAPASHAEFLATVTRGADPVDLKEAAYRFAPGDLLGERYRIVLPLGRGGMGEVYRADDLSLGVSVALKILPERLATNPTWLARFRKEVAAARQVSHPHVCRVYDIAEVDGLSMLSMEFIAGDDLAAIVRKVGRLSSGLAIDLTRQIARGLDAVHDEGLVHRDLKPANVMIDGRGRAKLADFGLAATAASVQGNDAYAGTPAYQAPEQLAGGELSERTDLYALGLLAYELLSGRRPYGMTDRDGLIRAQMELPPPPSTFDATVPPEVDRVVLKCLAADPLKRPASAAEVYSTLPGDAALNAALAAGVTPSAEVVADAGGEGRLSRQAAILLAAGTLLCTIFIALLFKDTYLLGRMPQLSPTELKVRASTIAAEFEPHPGPFVASGPYFDSDYSRWHRQKDLGSNRLNGVAAGRPLEFYYWYRVSDVPMVPSVRSSGPSFVTPLHPPIGIPGSVLVRMDFTGRLLTLHRVPRGERTGMPNTPPDKIRLFALAGLDPDVFHDVKPTHEWSIPFDRRDAWTGVYPERPDIPLMVEVATDRGEVVGFRLVSPWTQPEEANTDELKPSNLYEVTSLLFGTVFPMLMLVVGGALAFGHTRAGRADWRGASVLALIDAGVSAVDLTALVFHEQRPHLVKAWVLEMLMKVLFNAVIIALGYLAFEPFVRRRWPLHLIGWTRLFKGRWRDPMVGRDVLTGAFLGACVAMVCSVTRVIPQWFGLIPETPAPMVDSGNAVGGVTVGLLRASTYGIMVTFVVYLTSRIVRTPWLWVPLLVGLLMLMSQDSRMHPWLYYPPMYVCCVGSAWLFCRRGLLAFAAGIAVCCWHLYGQLTFDFTTSYWLTSVVSLTVIVMTVLYGLVVSVGGWRRLLTADSTA